MADKPKKLLDQVRDKVRLKNYSYATEKTYVGWIRRYILFHQKRHPAEMGKAEIEAFLSHLAVEGNVAPSTQNQALHALLFLYRDVLEQPIAGNVEALRARERRRLPASPPPLFPTTRAATTSKPRRFTLTYPAAIHALRAAR